MGCKMFLNDAMKIYFIRNTSHREKQRTLYCPVDKAHEDFLRIINERQKDKENIKDTLMYHLKNHLNDSMVISDN